MNLPKEFSSNNTLTFYNGTTKPHYFLATYVRTRVLRISKIDYREMAAKLNCQIFIDISTKGIKAKDIKKVFEQGIRLSFEANESMLINSENKNATIHHHEHSERISLIIHKFLQVKLIVRNKYELVWAPFELIVCKLALRVKKIRIVHNLEESKKEAEEECKKLGKVLTGNEVFPVQTEYHFNIMDHPDMNMKLTLSSNSKFGLFKIANNKFHVEYRNGFLDKEQIEKMQSEENKKIERRVKKLRGEIDAKGDNELLKKILRYESTLDDEVSKLIEKECELSFARSISEKIHKRKKNENIAYHRLEAERLVLENDEKKKIRDKNEHKDKIKEELYEKLRYNKIKEILDVKQKEEDELRNLLQKPEKIQSFDVAIFEIPIYKIPLVPTLTIALPIFFLAIINLGVFYQTPELKDRIVSVSLLLVSFVALIPTIREQIPPTPVYTILEVIVFAEGLTTILALIESVDVDEPFDENGPSYNFTGKNVYFIVSIIITAISMMIVAMMSLAYACFWRKEENKVGHFPQMILDQPIKNDEWSNKECDDYFKRILSQETESIVEDTEIDLRIN